MLARACGMVGVFCLSAGITLTVLLPAWLFVVLANTHMRPRVQFVPAWPWPLAIGDFREEAPPGRFDITLSETGAPIVWYVTY